MIDNVVYLDVDASAINNPLMMINGEFDINMALDEEGTGTEDSPPLISLAVPLSP